LRHARYCRPSQTTDVGIADDEDAGDIWNVHEGPTNTLPPDLLGTKQFHDWRYRNTCGP